MTRIVEPLLGTRAEVAVFAPSRDVADALEQAIVVEVGRLEQIFTVFDRSSALHQLRQTGTTDLAELSEVLGLARHWQRRTGGAFNAAMAPLMDRWQEAEADEVAPSEAELARLAGSLSDQPDPAALNLNAIAKGWIAHRALSVGLAVSASASGGWLSLGGDVVHHGAGSVVVGIEDPARPYDNVPPLASIEVANEALATSGGARRWWTVGGTRYSKVLDPRTGMPADDIASATVVAGEGATADVLATVALVLPVEETLALARAEQAVCFLVSSDGSVRQSSDRFKPS